LSLWTSLTTAAEAEDGALRAFRNNFQSEAPQEGLFQDFDLQVVEANKVRRAAQTELVRFIRETSEESRAVVQAFSQGYDTLEGAWDKFDQDFATWRRTDGGCDRLAALQTLRGFVVAFGGLSSEIRRMPKSSQVQSLGELFIEAADREDGALRLLAENWKPFDTRALDAFENERRVVDRLRRQVSTTLNTLLEQHQVALQDVSR
jgi:hypothetical protein